MGPRARVVAFAVRTGSVQHLASLGFEHLPGRPEAPARLYRRRINLAKKVFATIKDEVGMSLFDYLNEQQG